MHRREGLRAHEEGARGGGAAGFFAGTLLGLAGLDEGLLSFSLLILIHMEDPCR